MFVVFTRSYSTLCACYATVYECGVRAASRSGMHLDCLRCTSIDTAETRAHFARSIIQLRHTNKPAHTQLGPYDRLIDSSRHCRHHCRRHVVVAVRQRFPFSPPVGHRCMLTVPGVCVCVCFSYKLTFADDSIMPVHRHKHRHIRKHT